MKRPMTLVASILGLLMSVVFIGASITFFVYGVALSHIDGIAYGEIIFLLLMVFGVFPFIFGVLAMSFNIVAITSWNKNPKIFEGKSGKNKAAIVFNFFLWTYAIVELIVISEYLKFTLPIYIISIIIFLTVNILLIVDLSLEEKRAKKFNENQTVLNAELENKKLNDEKLAKQKELKEKIAKLDYMKTLGMITEQEMSELRKRYAQELIKYL